MRLCVCDPLSPHMMEPKEIVMRQLLTEKETAEFLDLQPATLRHWRVRERGPLYYRIGGAIRYHRKDLEDFLNECRVGEGLGR